MEEKRDIGIKTIVRKERHFKRKTELVERKASEEKVHWERKEMLEEKELLDKKGILREKRNY